MDKKQRQDVYKAQADVEDDSPEEEDEDDDEEYLTSGQSLDEVLAEVDVRIRRLKAANLQMIGRESDDLEYLGHATFYGSYGNTEIIQICDKLADPDMMELYKNVLNAYGVRDLTMSVGWILYILMSGSGSARFRQAILDNKLHEVIFDILSDDYLNPNTIHKSKNKLLIAGKLLATIENTAHVMDSAVRVFREYNGVGIIRKYLACQNEEMRYNAESALAYVMTDKEYEENQADDSSIQYMVSMLEEALKNPNPDNMHVFKGESFTMGCLGIIGTLKKMAGSDYNKEKIVRHGALRHYVALLKPNTDPDEQFEAVKGIWILAFKCKTAIRAEDGCLTALKRLAAESPDADIQEQAKGALWELEDKDKTLSRASSTTLKWLAAQSPHADIQEQAKGALWELEDKTPTLADSTEPCRGHVFLSYQWNNQATILRIRDVLERRGYNVWMDVEKISGSILQAMADGIEKAEVVVLSMSEKYKDSPSCRTEAEYAYTLRKKIVPLRMQNNYTADGWLGAILGTKLYYDFSSEDRFDESIKGVIKELGECGKVQPTGAIGVDLTDQASRCYNQHQTICDRTKCCHLEAF